MSNGMYNNIPQIIYTYNVTRTSSAATMNSVSIVEQTTTIMTNSIPSTNTDISPMACLGFTILILATVVGNSLVLLALYLDKRLHSPSFYLIANMALADLLLGKYEIF
jgi:capsular polysaccharide biosynthesis protein